ncbi:MAG TPA: amylo-alpha-1,6-glucosidase [Terriglobales bacterium]|nr:amylo-alpha-1,6-glucosidase [Terriglobales bacterium]
MSTQVKSPELNLVPIEPPSRSDGDFQVMGPRKVDNLTLIDGKTFLATRVSGDITPPRAPDVGFFHDDTRFLSFMELRAGGQRTVLLSSATEKTFLSQIELTTSNIHLRDSFDLPENTIHIRREQMLSHDVLFERITFENFNLNSVELDVEMEYGADFVDVFQVRGMGRNTHGQYFQPVVTDDSIEFFYRGRDNVLRHTLIEMEPQPANIDASIVRWNLKLEPSQEVQFNIRISPFVEGERAQQYSSSFSENLKFRRERFADWEAQATHFTSSNDVFDVAMQTAVSDFHALQIPEGGDHIIAAGIPWFATMFGRDSIIAAYQSLSLNPQLAMETLRVLAHYQGTEYNDWQDEEPGKILHEYREGEMTRSGEMPFGPYYGTIDATPLWLILLGETWNWTADEELVRELLPAAYKALDWIDKYGDFDGDGFVEYLRRSKKGLTNQGWKDSWDANMHRDGTVAKAPIALVEVQGYVYDAKYRMASLLRIFGDSERADKLKKDCNELAKRFEKAYWVPDRGFYAMALDGEKKPLEVISSNPGHLLFTRIINRDRARAIVNRLMRPDMFSGWGWRTMSSDEKTFNPLSYHRGSVWPHDNSLIAHGMALNEHRAPVARLFTTLFQAALTFRDYRLPELFCGIERKENDMPVHYPVSCSPQAWASGSYFLILSSLLGIRPSAPRKELNIINPMLPDFLDHLHVRNLKIGKSRVGLDFTRRGERTFCNVVEVEGEKLVVNVVFKK